MPSPRTKSRPTKPCIQIIERPGAHLADKPWARAMATYACAMASYAHAELNTEAMHKSARRPEPNTRLIN